MGPPVLRMGIVRAHKKLGPETKFVPDEKSNYWDENSNIVNMKTITKYSKYVIIEV